MTQLINKDRGISAKADLSALWSLVVVCNGWHRAMFTLRCRVRSIRCNTSDTAISKIVSSAIMTCDYRC